MIGRATLAVAALLLIAGLVWLVISGGADEGEAPVATGAAEVADGEPDGTMRVPLEATAFERALSGVCGRLVEHDGTPVSDVDVTLLEVRASLLQPDLMMALRGGPLAPRLVVATASTDAEGRFALGGVPTSTATIAVRRASTDPWHVAAKRPVDEEVGITIPAPGALVVNVVALTRDGGDYEPGPPVTGAEIFAQIAGTEIPGVLHGQVPFHRLLAVAEEGSPGRYRISELPCRTYGVVVLAEGFSPGGSEAKVTSGETSVTIPVVRELASDAELLVLDAANGEPVSGAEISLHMADAVGPSLGGGQTDGLGRLRLGSVPDAGGFDTVPYLRVEHPAYAVLTVIPLD